MNLNFEEDNKKTRINCKEQEKETGNREEYEGILEFKIEKREWECRKCGKKYEEKEKNKAIQHVRSEHNRTKRLREKDTLDTTDEE